MSILLVVCCVRAATAEAYESTSGFTVNHSGGSSFYSLTVSIGNFAGQTTATIDSLTNITSIDITYNHSSGGGSGLYVNAWYLDDKVLVDAPSGFSGGTFKKLYQNWTEQQAVVFYARIAAADLLMQALRDQCPTVQCFFIEDYCEGTVDQVFAWPGISVVMLRQQHLWHCQHCSLIPTGNSSMFPFKNSTVRSSSYGFKFPKSSINA